MAPKAKDGSSNRSITDFFKRFANAKSSAPNNDALEDEIVVASPLRTGSRSLETRQQPAAKSQYAVAPRKSKTVGRSRKPSVSSSPLSSSSSEVNTLKRKRKSPRISRIQSASDSPSISPNASQLLNVNPTTGVADVTPTPDSPFREASATPRRRVLLGSSSGSASSKSKSLSVSPSPEQMAAPPIPPPQFQRPANEASKMASFTSTSTLSTAPRSSQTSSMPISSTTSSRRVVRDGLQGIKDSESEDSDDELADPSSFLMKRTKLTPPAESTRNGAESVAASGRQKARTVNQRVTNRFSKPLLLSPPRTEFKNSNLAKLVAKNEERRLAQERIQAMEAEVEESKQREAQTENQDDQAFDRDAYLALANDDDQREELIVALERTEALKAASHFYFFLDDEPKWPNEPFPVHNLPEEPWSRIYRDDHSRTEACISGLATELAEQYPLPMNITSWFASQLMHEPSEMLCEAYVEILRVSSEHHFMSETFASLSSYYHTWSVSEANDRVKKALPTGLQYVLRTLQFYAPASDSLVPDALPTNTCAAFLDMALLNIDVLVTEDTNLSRVTANCIQAMLEDLSDASFQMLVTDVLGNLFTTDTISPLFRCRAIVNLPCTTTRSYKLRRRLALECFSTVPDRQTADDQDWFASILHTLRTHPKLRISEDLDCDYLMAVIAVLDVAVANGFTDYSHLKPPPPPTQAAGMLTFSKARPMTEEERSHNQQIDRLIEQLQDMMSRIKDSGTSHLGRIQAKSLIEGIVVRLEACVRTRPRPKKSVFNANRKFGTQARLLEAMPVPAAKMSSLREKLLEAKKERNEVEIVQHEMLSDREGEGELP